LLDGIPIWRVNPNADQRIYDGQPIEYEGGKILHKPNYTDQHFKPMYFDGHIKANNQKSQKKSQAVE
jgi:hypothetical protein